MIKKLAQSNGNNLAFEVKDRDKTWEWVSA